MDTTIGGIDGGIGINIDSEVTLNDVTFSDNHAEGGSGGAIGYAGMLVLKGCNRFIKNLTRCYTILSPIASSFIAG